MRDLEIRGAGNILGTAQSGHIVSIGFDLYCSLLKQAVAKLKGEKVRPRLEVVLRTDFVVTREAEYSPGQRLARVRTVAARLRPQSAGSRNRRGWMPNRPAAAARPAARTDARLSEQGARLPPRAATSPRPSRASRPTVGSPK